VRDTVAYFAERSLPFRWMVTPSTRPADTTEVLLANGFEHAETLIGMAADPEAFPPPAREDIEVVEVRSDDERAVEAWLAVCTDAWGLAPDAVDRFRASLERRTARDDHAYLARIDGRPAATAALSFVEDFGHFDGASTSKAYHAGLRQHHVIVAVNGKSPDLHGRAFLVWFRLNHRAGDEVELTVLENGKRRKITYTL